MKSNNLFIDEIGFTFLECPKCHAKVDEDDCTIDNEGKGYCPFCETHLFTDKPIKEVVEFT